MTGIAPTNANNKVDIAVLGTRLEYAIGLLEKQAETSEKQDERIRANELAIVKHTEQIRNRTWIAGVAQAIGTGLGIAFGGK